jgi:hypothetical protein
VAKSRKKRTKAGEAPKKLMPFQLDVVFYVGTFLLCLVVYHGISDNYLYNDDFLWLSHARHEMNAGNVLSFRVIGFFRPLINVSFFLMEKVSPGNIPLHYHLNFLLHYLTTILVFHLLYLLFRNRTVAAATAVYFLVTSIHASAVV